MPHRHISIKSQLLRSARQAAASVHQRLGNKPSLLILAAIIGLASGLAASLLKALISAIASFITANLNVDHGNFVLLIVPGLGLIATACYCRYILGESIAHGCDILVKNLKDGIVKMRANLIYAPIIASSITIGCGGSAGAEGPIAYAGAAIGSNVGRLFALPDGLLRILIGFGAAAGIAAIFKSPIGGALFTLEVLQMRLTTISIIALLVCCIISAGLAYLLSGCTLDVVYTPDVAFSPEILGAIFLLGLLCGLYSIYYSSMMSIGERWLNAISNHWIKNIIAAATLALLIFLFPSLYGEGYTTMTRLIDNDYAAVLDYSPIVASGSAIAMPLILIAILAVKAFATQATNSGGGVGGDFAPTLFAGSIAGYAFAIISNSLFATHLPAADFALYGMAAVMAGSVQAPLMAIFLTTEMTGAYGMLFPVILASAISYATVKTLSRHTPLKSRPSWRHILLRPQ
jgi:CIC family chloride channel protein